MMAQTITFSMNGTRKNDSSKMILVIMTLSKKIALKNGTQLEQHTEMTI